MNKHNDWEKLLAYANEDLAKIGYQLELEETEGCYDCKVTTDGYVVEVYAENYTEEELSDLITDAWHDVKEKYKDTNKDEDYCYEHCPHCDAEVALKAELSVQTCPNCGKRIPACSMCMATDANDGKKYCSNCCLCYQADVENALNEEGETEEVDETHKKETYKVEVCRIGYSFATIEVEAENEDEAEDLALEKAGNYDYSEKDAEYSVECVNLA